jgi:UDP-GlcNAc:undecaprenyl-phosphate GlcNAc-1-phosphate transferase
MQAVIARHLFALTFSFLLGIYLIPIVIRAAQKIGFMDNPDGHLKHQKEPIPYLGGVAVFLPFITTLGLCYPFQNQMLWLLLGATLLLFIGLVDDLKVLKPQQKFFGQFLASLCLIKGGFSLKTPFFSSLSSILWSLFWMLSVINAFNLVDVMDGLCTTLALLSTCIFAVMAYLMGLFTVSLLLTAFAGSLVAFLAFNKPPAKIYLGDAGSLFIGGLLASVPFLLDWPSCLFEMPFLTAHVPSLACFLRPLLEVFFIPAIILWVPLLEGVGLLVIRTRLGIPFYKGSPHHFSLYLQRKGWPKERILYFVTLITLVLFGLIILFMARVLPLGMLALALAGVAIAWIVMVFG